MSDFLNIVVLISGHGSNLQAIIDASQKDLKVKIAAVISNQKDAYGLKRAEQAKIPNHVVANSEYSKRSDFEKDLAKWIDFYHPDLIVLAGFMRPLSSHFVTKYLGRMINIHPSLLPKFPGLNTHQRALEAKESLHGASIHFVTKDIDAGPIICQGIVLISPEDNAQNLQERVQKIEHQLYPQALSWFCEHRIKLMSNLKVEMDGKILSKPIKLK